MKKIVLIVLLGLLLGCATTILDENENDKLASIDTDKESFIVHSESIEPDLSEAIEQKEYERNLESDNQNDFHSSEDNQQTVNDESKEVDSTEASKEEETEPEFKQVFEKTNDTAPNISSDIPSEIAELLNDNIGIVYQNLITGKRIAHNENKFFYAASTVKTIIAMQLVEMNVDFNMLVEKTRDDYEGGNGYITKQANFGDKFPLHQVIYEMIVNSDNTATQMAFRVGRSDSFWKYAKNYSDSNGHIRLFDGSNSVTPEYMTDALVHLYQYSGKYDFIIDYKHQAKDLFSLIDGSIPYAKKPGRYGTHNSQIGIVYDTEPYVFVIYVQNDVTQEIMQQLSAHIYDMHRN